MRRLAPVALVWSLVALALGVAAAGAAPPASLPDGPDPSAMALGAEDFARASVVDEGHQQADGAVAVYTRDFAPARAGRTPLLSAWNEVAILNDETEARQELTAIRNSVASPSGRAALGRSFRTSFSRSTKLKITKLSVSRPSTLGIGVQSLRFAITFKTRLGRFHVVFVFVRVDRAIGHTLLIGYPGRIVAAGDVKRLATAQRDRFRRALTVTSRTAPTVTGTATPGSTLTADTGRWNGGPSQFAHQWFRCDAAGTCTPIAGAHTETYTVTPEDAGSTLRVTVAARNSVSMSTADSARTGAVA